MLDTYDAHLMDLSEWVDSIPPVATEDERYACVSPLLSPSQYEEDSVNDHESDIADKDLANGFPTHLRPEDAFWTRMRLVQIRNFLIRCQLLYITVRCMERKPWKPHSDIQLDRYYKKIRYLAIKARNIAEAIGGDDLRARAEYWAGRGCGGLQDWQGAMTHFAAAMKFDVPNFTDEKGKLLQRGLLQDEKDDVEFLLQSVKQREQDLQQKKENVHKEKYGDGHPNLHPPDIKWHLLKGPRWTPDRDRVVEIAKQQYGGKRRSMTRFTSTETGVSDYTKEEVKFIYQRMSKDDGKEFPRKMLSEEEWRYIMRGDERRYDEEGSPQQSQHSESSIDTDALLPPNISNSSSEEGFAWESSRVTSLDSNNKHLQERPTVSNPVPPSPRPSALFNMENRDVPPSPRPSIKDRRKKKVGRIFMPPEQTRRLASRASRASRRSGGSGDSAETGDEESEGEMVDVRLDNTPHIETSASSVSQRDVEDESGGKPPRVARSES
ncbi:hypothetical protein PTNB29_07123 [Pyrenophora teres f. teres]|nr:hypothetical protein PTNB29_07123 [Pyrenophora teres f. teres]